MYNPTKPYKHKIIKLIESTWDTPYVKVKKGLYPIITKKISFPEVQHTDGIGTKGWYHWQKRTFKNAVLDALAMNVNDLLMVGAVPYALQNHLVLPKDDHKAIVEIVKELSIECRKRNIAITGGETSIHSDMPGMDISMTVCGFIKEIRENKCRIGDVLAGIESNGLHSNGITKVREVFKNQYRKEFTEPTTIYTDQIFPLLNKYKINGMMHITGGAFTKLKDILGNDADIEIQMPQKLKPQPIFQKIYKKGVSDQQMYSLFNCGVGFVISAPEKEHRILVKRLKNSEIIGKVIRGNGKIHIQSSFSRKTIHF